MKSIDFRKVKLKGGFMKDKQELNRKITVNAVYEKFSETGRIGSLDFNYREGNDGRPHIYWDSDIAKWMEGAAYILSEHDEPELEKKLDSIIEKICAHQCADGYFNTYFTSICPARRFSERDWHELYCAGHLIEAAIACDMIGKGALLECMKKYIDLIRRVFVEEKSAKFASPGHEEIEIALLRLYRYTGKREYLDLAAHFINIRGTAGDYVHGEKDSVTGYPDHVRHNQSHLPVREQQEAVGHAVRAVYLYTSMAMLARDTGEKALLDACDTLYRSITREKMYVTGGIGSTCHGESFTNPYHLPPEQAYTETCASIGLMFFARAMSENEENGIYADTVERAFYNGVISGLSSDGRKFFYKNPLEIDLNEHFTTEFGAPRWPDTRRSEVFRCSCCPPNLTRLLPALGGYIFSLDDDRSVLYINQYTDCEMHDSDISCVIETDYPASGIIKIKAAGTARTAVRIPAWCTGYRLSVPHEIRNGYAFIDCEHREFELELDISPRLVYADSRAARLAGRACIARGPIIYCAEGIDNGEELHRFILPREITFKEIHNGGEKLPQLEVGAYRLCDSDGLYFSRAPQKESAQLRLIPFHEFANREESNMRVFFTAEM